MRTLMAKDLRLLRPLLLFAAGLAVLCYGIVPAATTAVALVNWWPSLARARGDFLYLLTDVPLRTIVDNADLLWPALGVLLVAAAGAAFALERRHGWTDFVATLPVSRRRTVAAKAGAVALAFGVMAGVNVLVPFVTSATRAFWIFGTRSPFRTPWNAVALSLAAVSVAWLLRQRRWGVRIIAASAVCGGAQWLVVQIFQTRVMYAYWDGNGHGYVYWALQSLWPNSYTTAAFLTWTPLVLASAASAWLLSSLIRSPTLAAVLAAAAACAVFFGVTQTTGLPSLTPVGIEEGTRPVRAVLMAWAVLAAVAGTMVQLRRQSP